jgi:hypothetical protein
MRRNVFAAIATITALLTLTERGDGQAASGQIAFADIARILDRRCTACHNADGAPGAADLNLEAEFSSAIVGRKSTEAAQGFRCGRVWAASRRICS